ncbi:MAG: LUD domain-containing protein, partial [Bacteroidota bacterium]
LPDLPTYRGNAADLLATFTEVLTGSKAAVIQREALVTYVQTHFSDAKTIVSTVAEVKGTLDLENVQDPLELAGVDLAVITGRLGVAENGAIWVTEEEAVVRVLPFITQHLIIVMEGPLVPTMHEAYPLAKVGESGFGVFIAGPSKTADIEQSLVIGAHGPRSLVVVL